MKKAAAGAMKTNRRAKDKEKTENNWNFMKNPAETEMKFNK